MLRRSPSECAVHSGSPELDLASFGVLDRGMTCCASGSSYIAAWRYHMAGG